MFTVEFYSLCQRNVAYVLTLLQYSKKALLAEQIKPQKIERNLAILLRTLTKNSKMTALNKAKSKIKANIQEKHNNW